MSQSLSAQSKQWVLFLQANDFITVRKELRNYPFDDVPSTTKIDQCILRLLVYLCQSATKCPTTDLQSGRDVFALTTTICNRFTSIPSTSSYYSSLYHIIRVLLEMHLFEEAMSTCDYLLPSSKWHIQMQHEAEALNDNYSRLWSIFYVSIDKFLRSKTPGSITPSIFQRLMTIIKYQLNIEELAKCDGSKTLLLKLLVYTDLLQSLHCRKEDFDEFIDKFFIKYLGSIELSLGDRNRIPTYQNFNKIITKISIYYLKNQRLDVLQIILKKYLRNFENCMLTSRESSNCYQIWRKFIKILLKPGEYLKEDSERIRDLSEHFQVQILSYNENSLVKYNIYSIASILEALLAQWTESLPQDLIIAIANLGNYLSEIIRKYPLEALCSCGKSCLVLQDSVKSAQLKVKLLMFLHRLCPTQAKAEAYAEFTLISSQCVDILDELRGKNCEKWRNIWLNIAPSIYNFTFNFAGDNQKNVELYTFLAKSIVRLRATDEASIFFQNNLAPPLSAVLHRLSNIHYSEHQYHKARIFTALNVYLHPKHPECKGYRNWSFIHHQDSTSRGLTLVGFLKKHTNDLKVLGPEEIKLKNDVLKDICLREIKFHVGMKINFSESIIAVIHQLEALNADDITYATAVHQLGYHCLNFYPRDTISNYLKNAMSRLKTLEVNSCDYDHVQYLKSHLAFYETVEEIRDLEETTRTEMKSTNIKLHAVGSSNGVSTKGSNIVPAFSQINMGIAKTLYSKLENIYNLWRKCLTLNSIRKWNSNDGTSAVKVVILAGEYCRFYRYKNLEIKFWKMAYGLALDGDSPQWIVYTTARAITSRYIKEDWITNSEKIISTKLLNSKDARVLGIISMFKMSLSDYYYYIGRTKEADVLFDEGKSITTLDLGENCGTFVFSQCLQFTHRFHNFPLEKKNNLEYTGILAHTLYAMVLIDDLATESRDAMWSLYEMDMLMEVSCNIATRMNALYSFREITAHLVRRLNVCQTKTSVLRVAEILKYLCIIDLSRNQLEDCEVKLQGLEHMLQIETFEGSMQSDLKYEKSCTFRPASPDSALMDPIRDLPQNNSSPILRRERFEKPEFMSHDRKCKCFACGNEAYKFLVFSCTHIRAQLYSLQNLTIYARQHFKGALSISEGLFNLLKKEENHQHYYVIDYVLFLLDYVRFLKHDPHTYEEGKKIVIWALEICDIYELESHPVYMSSMEIVLEYRYNARVLPNSELVIPPLAEIDVNEYVDPIETSETLCVTPAKEAGHSPPLSRSPRRVNKPPLLSLTKATVDTVESDPEDLSPGPLALDKRKKQQALKVKPVRRKLVEDVDFDQDEESSSRRPSCSIKDADLRLRVTSLLDEASIAAPSCSRKLHVLRKRLIEEPVTEKDLQNLLSILQEGRDEFERPKSRGRPRRALGSIELTMMNVEKIDEIIQDVKAIQLEGASGKGKVSSSRTSRSRKLSDGVVSSTKDIGQVVQVQANGRSSRSSRSSSSTGSVSKGSDGIASGNRGTQVEENLVDINRNPRGSRSSSRASRTKKVDDCVASLTKAIEGLSVENSGPTVAGNKMNRSETENSDDELVESSIIEPRRSRRLVGKNTTETKTTRRRL